MAAILSQPQYVKHPFVLRLEHATYPMKYICMFDFLLWFSTAQFYPYPSGLLHWHWGNHMIAPVSVMQPWRIWVNDSPESNNNLNIWLTQTEWNITKQFSYLMGYTVSPRYAITIWWCHDMEMVSALLALCEGNPSINKESVRIIHLSLLDFPCKGSVMLSFNVSYCSSEQVIEQTAEMLVIWEVQMLMGHRYNEDVSFCSSGSIIQYAVNNSEMMNDVQIMSWIWK